MLQLRELGGIEIEILRVPIECARDFGQLDHGRGVRPRTFRQAGIDLFQLAQEALRFRELVQDGVVDFGKLPRNRGCKLDQAPAVARPAIAVVNLFFLVRLEPGRADFLDLVAEQLHFLLAHRSGAAQGFFLRPERLPAAKSILAGALQRLRVGKAVEQGELAFRGEERLVIVRPMQIDQLVADRLEQGERGRGAVDEMPAVSA